eukprot:CAMPEP_0202846200 /NCGR_PEP_ID=MMETSP1389-20130828/72090_1 /ASSEMBLY_ACC=CAM_ASM_000865 /TAXON_ID=302021 /ORGANISM="Rhodomonas sp., Strain CCMP768" /LENGTH=31 /DNA_ID= /DNA_START= /DNA_END= /DNA_ORIENTATION=
MRTSCNSDRADKKLLVHFAMDNLRAPVLDPT